ncbi:unnamed protein product [Lymnaea stagnalis]|uniref:Uncharacterized protein n=1 Tax=Lymnaea stagnalis TaxID=6523 RepID=A0AAV2HX17_LYMST
MMGNSNSTADDSIKGSEMRDAEELKTGVSDTEPLCDVTELQTECLQLKRGVRILALAIDNIFYNDDSGESARDMETRLLALTSRNQAIVQKLIKNLEGHARLVHQGSDKNEVIMAMVRDLVTTINGYMAMLIRNIRKLKRLVSETRAVKRVPKAAASEAGSDRLVYDVIGDHQDVDAMLIQLMETAAHREELEKDIVSVLVFWKCMS